jgi:hypothetical protein
MKCKIDITAGTDLAAWVTRDTFMNNVDLDDLALRESKVVLDWYHPGWFRNDNNGALRFTPPAFIFSRGQLRGINGRHRAVLLYRHLDIIPMLLVNPKDWPEDKIHEIVQREIREDEVIELPNLLINKALAVSDESSISETDQRNINIKINF